MDTISRQAAIGALDALCQEHEYKILGKGETYSQYNEAWQDALDIAERAIFNLPSARPEPCEDTVSRQRLLSDLKELITAWKKYPVMTKQIKGVEAAIEYVKAIPPAEPERKKGEWIPYLPEGLRYKCSECESRCDIPWHFCPNCGSYNGGGQSEND